MPRRSVRGRGGLPPPRRPYEPLAEEGVTCVVCHLRGGTVLTPETTTALVTVPLSATVLYDQDGDG